MGLSTDPAATISFDEDGEGTGDSTGKAKKISLVDYFYIKVSLWQCPSDDSTTVVSSNQGCLALPSERILSCLWKYRHSIF